MRDSDFHALIDSAILSGRSSHEIAVAFGIRAESVRKMRRALRQRGLTPRFEGQTSNADRKSFS